MVFKRRKNLSQRFTLSDQRIPGDTVVNEQINAAQMGLSETGKSGVDPSLLGKLLK